VPYAKSSFSKSVRTRFLLSVSISALPATNRGG
jgi:hypothetical protein